MQPAEDTRLDRRRQILDAAVRVFAQKGHDHTRIQDVADAAGVAYGLVYHYFGTKDRLLQTVFDENWAIFGDVVDGIVTSGRPVEHQLRAVLDYALGAVDAYPDRIRVILLEYGRLARLGEALSHPGVARVMAALRGSFAQARAAGVFRAEVDERVLPVVLLGALQAAIVTMLVDPDAQRPDRAAVRATLLSLFRGALAPAGGR